MTVVFSFPSSAIHDIILLENFLFVEV